MKSFAKVLFILAVVCCLLYAGSANASETRGGGTIVTFQNGDWGVGTTWVGGTPPDGFDNADINHAVTVTGSESSLDSIVGVGSAGSLSILPGGSLTVGIGGLIVGAVGIAGTLVIEGTGALTTFTLDIGDGTSPGTLIIRPTANGSGGLTAIIVSSILDRDGTTGFLSLDTSLYTPVVSDSWTAATYGSLSGVFADLIAPAGFTISSNVSRGGLNL